MSTTKGYFAQLGLPLIRRHGDDLLPRRLQAGTLLLILHFTQLFGCAAFAPIENRASSEPSSMGSYSIDAFSERMNRGENSFMLAFSGGGTRAAALSYGVLKALHDTTVKTESGEISALSAVDSITSVSGGSFTSAYYGLYGDRIFENFESDFLRKNVQGDLLNRLFNPFNWFRIGKRTEWAVEYYEEHVFRGATYADLLAANGPLIVINASDLTAGVGFWFLQDNFDLLCSDILDFPISRAVAASSAVPGLFAPVVLKNFDGCPKENAWLLRNARAEALRNPELDMVLRGLESYTDTERRPYIHLVDGGITDNLGLRGLYDISRFTGGMSNYYRQHGRKVPRRIIIIAVNASTEPDYSMSRSHRIPPVAEVMGAMSGVQLHRYNADTLAMIEQAQHDWAKELSTPERTVKTYFIRLNLSQVTDPDRQEFLNRIPTSFSLTDEQVDALIETGEDLLRENPVFEKLLRDVQSDY